LRRRRAMSRCTFMISAARSSELMGCGALAGCGRVGFGTAGCVVRGMAGRPARGDCGCAVPCGARFGGGLRADVDDKLQLAAAGEGIDAALSQKAHGVEIGTWRSPCFWAMRRAMRNCRPVRPSARMAASSCSAVGVPRGLRRRRGIRPGPLGSLCRSSASAPPAKLVMGGRAREGCAAETVFGGSGLPAWRNPLGAVAVRSGGRWGSLARASVASSENAEPASRPGGRCTARLADAELPSLGFRSHKAALPLRACRIRGAARPGARRPCARIFPVSASGARR
jgi:hypothetical protein